MSRMFPGVTKVSDSVIRLKIQAYLCKKNVVNNNTQGILIFPYDDKQFILLISMRNNNP